MADAILDIRNLSKSFGGLKATDDVSLDLRPGEIHALIGPNGAGKTTLIHQICGTLKPGGGSIRFLGQEILGLGVSARARLGLGRTFQISSLAMRQFRGGDGGASGEADAVERGHCRLGEPRIGHNVGEEAKARSLPALNGEHDVSQRREIHGERGNLEGAAEPQARPRRNAEA